MSNDYKPDATPNPELAAALEQAQSVQEVIEITARVLAQQGQRQRGIAPELDDNPINKNGYLYAKELRFSEASGKKPLILRANTVEDLDALERQILGY
jgi:hypothetical protein